MPLNAPRHVHRRHEAGIEAHELVGRVFLGRRARRLECQGCQCAYYVFFLGHFSPPPSIYMGYITVAGFYYVLDGGYRNGIMKKVRGDSA